jgi:hypothetical protein
MKTPLLLTATVAHSPPASPGSTPDPSADSPRRAYRQNRWSSSPATRGCRSRASDAPIFREGGRSRSSGGQLQSRLSGEESTLGILATDGVGEVLVDSADLAALLGGRDVDDDLGEGWGTSSSMWAV